MGYNTEEERLKQLQRCIPDIFTFTDVLYIGGHLKYGRNVQIGRLFENIEIVEAFEGNVNELRQAGYKVYHSDIMTWRPEKKYQVSMFWHGPEHLYDWQVPILIDKLKGCTTDLIVFATPFGVYDQGPEYGNDYETHRSHWRAADFEKLGMESDEMGETYNGNVISWLKNE